MNLIVISAWLATLTSRAGGAVPAAASLKVRR
jgi:hypothetical protein